MKDPVEKIEHFYFWVVAGTLGGALALGLLIWGGLQIFNNWQEHHLVRRAAAYLSGGETRSAFLNAKRAYETNNRSVEAARLLAEIAEQTGDGSELGWRSRVVELQPASIDDGLALVRTALRTNDLALADQTLRKMEGTAEQVAAYHAARGRLADMRQQQAEAEAHWAKAVALAPDEKGFEMQLAITRLGSNEEATRQSGRETLERLRSDEKQRAAATRALLIDGNKHKADPQRMRALASDLQGYAEAAFSDRLLYLEILRQMRDPAHDEYLASLEEIARSRAADAAGLISALNAADNSTEALRYGATLTPEVRAGWPVPLALVEAHARTKEWKELETVAAKADWGAFEFLRHAYLARAFRGLNQEIAADQEWGRAQNKLGDHAQRVLLLARTVSAWGWERETADLLWKLSKSDTARLEALQLLYNLYAKNGDTPGLYRVLLRGTELAPEDLVMQNNLAQISLLLGADVNRARKTAADLVQKEPANPAFVSTYAFSLFSQGDTKGALKAFLRLDEGQLKSPAIAAYYGIILAAAGETEKARPYVELGGQAFLLPEEKALLEKALPAAK